MAEIIQYLKKPIEYEGKKYEFLALDFEALTGKDVREAKEPLIVRIELSQFLLWTLNLVRFCSTGS